MRQLVLIEILLFNYKSRTKHVDEPDTARQPQFAHVVLYKSIASKKFSLIVILFLNILCLIA